MELRKKDDFFIRAYATNEDAGNSYDAVLTAYLMQDAAASDFDWENRYRQYWTSNIVDRFKDLDTSINWIPQPGVSFEPTFDAIEQAISDNPDSMLFGIKRQKIMRIVLIRTGVWKISTNLERSALTPYLI